jgi:hypothetical protein
MAKKPQKPEAREATLSLRLKPTVKAALEHAAVKDKRTLSAMAEVLLEGALEQRGYLK